MPGKNRSMNGAGRTPTMKFDRDEGSGILPEAIYQLRVDDVEVKQASNSEFPYLNVKYAVLYNGQPKGGAIWDVLSYSPNARFKFDQLFDAMNAPSSGEVPITWLKGKKVYVSLITQTYKGKISNKVGQYLTPEVAAAQMALDDEDEEEYDEDEDTDTEEDTDLEDDEDETYEEDEEEEEEVPVVAPVKKVKKVATPVVVAAPVKGKRGRPAKVKSAAEDDDIPY